jgi:hypothetical protein
MRRRLGTLAIAAGLLAGCETLGITTPRVDGVWLLSAQSLTDGARVCAIDGMRLTLEQFGTDVTGTSSGGTLTCVANGTTSTSQLTAKPIVNGSIDATDEIRFDLGGPDWRHEGDVVARSMTGIVRVRFGGSLGVALFTGNFGAARIEDEEE